MQGRNDLTFIFAALKSLNLLCSFILAVFG